jgi:hypothetical protein
MGNRGKGIVILPVSLLKPFCSFAALSEDLHGEPAVIEIPERENPSNQGLLLQMRTFSPLHGQPVCELEIVLGVG